MTDVTIPDAAVEAAARALRFNESSGMCELDRVCTLCDCIDPKTGEPKHRKFTSTLVTSAYDLCDLAKGLNVNNDPSLTQAVKILENALSGTTSEVLRTDDIKRAEVKQQVDALLGAFDFGPLEG